MHRFNGADERDLIDKYKANNKQIYIYIYTCRINYLGSSKSMNDLDEYE